jgi:CRP/FNR family transcriptional regulator
MISSRDLRLAVPWLAQLSDRTLERVAALARERHYAANQILFRAGDAADGLYLLLSGKVRVSRQAAPRVQLLHSETSGGVLGEIAVFGGGPFPATAVAIESTRCAHLPAQAVERLLREESEFSRFALQRLAVRARSLLRRIDELTATTITSRLAHYLLQRAEHSRGPDFTLGMSQEALAAEMGTAREVLVRALSTLVDVQAIRRTGRSRFAVARLATLRSIAAK